MFRSAIILLIVCLVCWSSVLTGQLSSQDHNPTLTHLLDRLETTGQLNLGHQSIRYQSLTQLIEAKLTSEDLSDIDRHDWNQVLLSIPERKYYISDTLDYLVNEKQGFLKSFYKTPYSFFKIDTEDFFLKIDPAIHFDLGSDSNDNNLIFQNTRGLKIRGLIDKKVYFYTSILENQQGFLNYEEDEITRINAIPGQAFFKKYQSGVIDQVKGWDYLNAQAYVGLKVSKSIDMQLGHGRHFIGDGIRSMLLSDYSNNYFYLQFNTKIWKLHLQNTFSELSARSSRDNSGDRLLPKKYMASHYLNYQVSDKLSFGLFESVIFSRENHFEFQYLNPVILYRTVEQFLDSPDNALLGLNMKWIPKNNYQLYGQVMIDELKTSQAFSGSGWWGNKIGFQLGIKKFDLFGVSNLDLQLEHNSARPYTYAHRDEDSTVRPVTSYSHYNQPLAHPYGANFRETIVKLKYRPMSKLYLQGLFLHSNYGTSLSENIGRDILANYETRASDFDNITGQGTSHIVNALHLNASWELLPNYFVDFTYINRTQSIEDSPSISTNYFGFGVRANISSRRLLL